MSEPAYHLRTNKNVERALFAELLRRVSPYLGRPVRDYCYLGMGGPLMEDFIAVQSVFPCKEMISLERFRHTHSRQLFNKPHCRVLPKLELTSEFVESYVTGEKPIVAWFDYMGHDWKKQIGEARTIIKKLPDMSIFKISLAPTRRGLEGNSVVERYQSLKKMFEPMEFIEDEAREENLPKTLLRVYSKALAEAIPDSPRFVCRPLAAYLYHDKTPFLTITVIVGPASQVKALIAGAELDSWPFANLGWSDPMNIDVPDLGLRERLAVEKLLPDGQPEAIHKELADLHGLQFAEEISESVAMLKRYVTFARHVPYFIKAHLA
jgi:hypothetical protein